MRKTTSNLLMLIAIAIILFSSIVTYEKTTDAKATPTNLVTNNEVTTYAPPIQEEIKVATKEEHVETIKNVSRYINCSSARIREKASTKALILGTIRWNTKVTGHYVLDGEWFELEDGSGFISSDLLNPKAYGYKTYKVTANKMKSWMPYTAITAKSSPQYKLQKLATTGIYGTRTVNDRCCIALGSYFTTKIGTYVDLELENGTVIPCILGDGKDNKHTDSKNMVTIANGCMTEFIVDRKNLNRYAKRDGDMSSCAKDWNSKVVKITVYDYCLDL